MGDVVKGGMRNRMEYRMEYGTTDMKRMCQLCTSAFQKNGSGIQSAFQRNFRTELYSRVEVQNGELNGLLY